jgi:7-cyano-7-deazaguanine synthase
MKKAVILLSAGLDSLTALSEAVRELDVVCALTVDYGQRAAGREIAMAKKIAAHYHVKHKIIHLPWYAKIIDSSLVNRKTDVPQLKNAENGNLKTAKAVWVPNRNGLFLNIAAAYAESLHAQYVIAGFNKEEAATFPDNSLAYCQAMDTALGYSTLNKVKIKNYFFNKNKNQIYAKALQNKAPLKYVWPCYHGDWRICGTCESCRRFLRAQENNAN